MWIRTLGIGAFLWGLLMMMGDRTAVVHYFGYPSKSRDGASLGVGHKPPDRRAAVDPLDGCPLTVRGGTIDLGKRSGVVEQLFVNGRFAAVTPERYTVLAHRTLPWARRPGPRASNAV
jgi:hypothetical protein